MRVKKLEIFGFKSFAKKTTIHFEPGVTAIVGPNGSGKCVHGDSRVVLADGRVVPIRELVEAALQQSTRVERWDDGWCAYNDASPPQILSLNPRSLKIEPRAVTAFVKRTAPETLYKVITKTGRELIATGYHPLFTLDDEGTLKTLPADQLKPGVRVAVPRRLPLLQTDDQLDHHAIFQQFERADSVYVPHSISLEQWVNRISARAGGVARASRGAGVEPIHVRTIRAAQALNVATLSRLETWAQAGDVWRGARLQSSRSTKAAMTIPERMTPVLARFLGYCISEGRNTSSDQVWFVNSDPALVEDFCACATETFGLEPRVLTYKTTTKDVLIFSHALCEYLGKAFQFSVNQPSAKKQVPRAVFAASDAVVLAFLSALFEGDGHVHISRNALGRKTQTYIEYATASRQLADDVCLLLLRLGIVGRIVTTWKAASNTKQRIRRQYYSVMISGIEQLQQLALLLKFRGEKRHALAQLQALQLSPNPNDDIVPGATRLVKTLVRQAAVPIKPIRRMYPTLAAYVEQRCEATRPGLARVLEAANRYGRSAPAASEVRARVQTLATSDVYWDAVTRIEPVSGETWVYDLTVEGHHNFIANGFIVHNSNVVDSIRWVLGEHNPRDVRAPRLEDVIFNGTDHQAPLSMAEVHLTISNEKGLLPISFTEVTITRRVYRSGESECFINQSPCRLKDVQELLLGTGLGGGTYAIIEQGHIDMILSSKPEERRVVFEEASGVAKYLSKKQETIRRLDEVEEHLIRIADIIGEVRRQVGALERAANKARQYKSQWEQLKQSELRLAVDELSSGEARHTQLEQQLQALNGQRDALESQKQQHMTSLEACNAAVSAIQQRLQELRTKVVECTSQIEQHESQFALKTRWIEELKQQATQLELEDAQLRARVAQFDEQLARVGGGESELQTQLGAIQEQVNQGSGELTTLEAAIQHALGALAAVKGQLFEAATDASHQRNQLTDSTAKLQSLEAHLARVEEQRAQHARHADDITQRQEAAVHEREVLQTQWDEAQRRVTTTQQTLEAAGAARHELTGRLHQLRDQMASERAQVTLLEGLWHRYEGFPDTVKTLMGHGIEGLIGPLVDLVQAVPGYEDVVESALGPLAEAIVVRDRNALSRCRQTLTAQQLEGCRFLVLSDCPQAPAEMERALVAEGVSGPVKQFIRAEAQYQPLVDWLLNDSWVIDDLQRLLGEQPIPQHRLVSAKGDRWDRRSWRFSGTRTASHSRIGRKQRWEQAQTSLQSLEQTFATLESQVKDAEQRWQSLLGEQESAKSQLAHLTPSLQKLQAHLSQLAHETKRIEEEQRARELETQELSTQREELRTSIAAAQRAAEEATARQQTLEKALTDAQSAKETSTQRQQQLLIAKAQVEATAQSVAERLQALQTRRQELDADRSHLVQQIESKTQQRRDALQRSTDLSQQLTGHEQGVVQSREERSRLEAEAEQVSQSLREEETKRDHVLPHLLEAEQQLNVLGRQIQEQGQQLSERAYRRTHLVQRLRELYQIDEAAIQTEQQANPPPLTDEQRASMTEQVQKLRAKLEGIGPVSLGSVEEYDELKRRLEFLQTQQQDLVQARDDLKASITQINRTARTQFRETFERIKQEFQHYYTLLFNGGEANLILMDEEDVLECGIDIVARPPGKRLQSISLLSGGERALTAVALLFALFKVRPSPFCILDEIDAPLDEANVDRFTRVLEEFLVLSQFILITHNKKTITKADSLYGVTMEEPGISKILSAKLKTAEPAAAAPAAVAA